MIFEFLYLEHNVKDIERLISADVVEYSLWWLKINALLYFSSMEPRMRKVECSIPGHDRRNAFKQIVTSLSYMLEDVREFSKMTSNTDFPRVTVCVAK